MMKSRNCAVLVSLVTLSACGTLPEERAISGAGIGAATGAVVGAVTSLAVGPAAVLGALGGGLTGALTKRDQINMGEPVWKQGSTQGAPPAADSTARAPAGSTGGQPAHSETVASVQSRLQYLGYNPGPVDGIYGKRTANAIRDYQRDHGLDIDGRVTAALEAHLSSTPKSGTVGI